MIQIVLKFLEAEFCGGTRPIKICVHIIRGAAILGSCGLFGAFVLLKLPAALAPELDVAEVPAVATPVEVSAVAASDEDRFARLFDPGFCRCAPVSFSQSAPVETKTGTIVPLLSRDVLRDEDAGPAKAIAELSTGENAPLPEPRPVFNPPSGSSPLRASNRRLIEPRLKFNAASQSEDHRSFFEKLFGLAPNRGPALAYASPEASAVKPRRLISSVGPSYGRFTAVYNVAAHTVFMPDGTRLEAHSGLGNMLDDPHHVNERNRGATPPDIYELEPREQLFHGVQALRLKPVGGGDIYGRTGLLAHTYMLGSNGDSNGCVSFRNYKAFLQAYQNGEIKHLVVVAGAS